MDRCAVDAQLPAHPEGWLSGFQDHRTEVWAFPLRNAPSPSIPCFSSHPSPAPSQQQPCDCGWRVGTCSPHPGRAVRSLWPPPQSLLAFFLPCLPWKALMRVHFIDNFMTLTVSPCNHIFKMTRCLQVGKTVPFFLLPAAKDISAQNNGTEVLESEFWITEL